MRIPASPSVTLLLLSTLCLSLGACGSSESQPGPGAEGGAPEGGSGGSSGGGDSGIAGHADAGKETGDSGLPVGTVGASGGLLSELSFAVAGDTRPPYTDDVSGYPTPIITKIYRDIEAMNPRPPFVVSTGDYQFSSTRSNSTASQQIALYMQARAQYSGAWFPAMGNHECTGADDSNCGPGNTDGITSNYTAFLTGMLGPIQKTVPYYSIAVNATDGSWTSKFVFTAANAWDITQQSWLTATMAQKTTYTFVIRHEPSTSNGNPAGVAAIDAVLGQYPYTLLLVGHSHTYGHPYRQVVLFGNGGAPLSGSLTSYGFGTFTRRADGAIVADEVDYMTGATDSSFHFVITADGLLTQ